MDPYSVTHLWQHFRVGVHALAHGERPLRERLIPVIQQVSMRFSNPEGFDPILRPIWTVIRRMCTRHQDTKRGSIDASITRMSDEDLEWLADAFVDMANWIERQIPEDLADAVIREKEIPLRLLEN